MTTDTEELIYLPLEQVDSEHCAMIVDNGLAKVNGVLSHSVELNNNRAVITVENTGVIAQAVNAIKDLGYGVSTITRTIPVLGMSCASCAISAESIVKDQAGVVILAQDEFIKPQTTAESLAQLKPSFAMMGQMGFDAIALQKYPEAGQVNHVHHAGNSSGIVDGAALVLIASEQAVQQHNLKPRAKELATALVGTDPTIMLTGPAPAARKALAKAGLRIEDIDLFEVNEAFAAVVLRFISELQVDPAKVNVNGGAIALGHPLGATGAMILGTLLDELERQDKKRGMATLCVGGGMGIATIIERI